MSNFLKLADGIQLIQIPTSSAPASPVNGMIYYDSTLNLFQKYEAGAWSSFSSTSVNAGTAGDLALYATTGSVVSDTYVQNTKNIKIAITAQPTRSQNITYNVPNPGDAVTSADFVLTQGAQTIAGVKTFSSAEVLSGASTSANITFATSTGIQSTSASSTLNVGTDGNATTINIGGTGSTINLIGSVTEIKSTVTTIDDPIITLNKGGATGSGSASGFQIEENGSNTGFVKSSAARTGFDIKAPATAGVATIRPNASSFTYDLPPASGTLLDQIVQDTAPKLGGALDTNAFSIISTGSNNLQLSPATGQKLQLAADTAPTRYVDYAYYDAETLTASTTAVLADLTFDSRTIKAETVEYTIVEATTFRRRTGKLMIIGDAASGTASAVTFVTDQSIETADVGVTWSAAISGNNIQVSYTTTANAKTLQMVVTRFLA